MDLFILSGILNNSIFKSKELLNTANVVNLKEEIVIKDNKSKDIENLLYHCDNIEAIIDLLNKGYKEKIDLIYIDPPFFTKSNYNRKVQVLHNGQKETIEYLAYNDTWVNGFGEYLEMLSIRLYLMKELLSEKGSMYVHLDYRSVHYIKIILDQIFGEENFLNEIIWAYKSGGTSNKRFSRKHESILVYTKTKNYIFNLQKEKSYNRKFKPYRFKGVKEYEDDLGWYTLVNLKDVWQIDMVGRTSGERVGYETQKPEALLQRILLSSSNEDSIVADFFAGSGTTLKVAENLNRRFIGSDIGNSSIVTIKKRLDKSYKILAPTENIDNELLGYKINIKNLDSDFQIVELILEKYKLDLGNFKLNKKYTDIINHISNEDSLALIDYLGIGVLEDYQFIFFEEYRSLNRLRIDTVLSFKLSSEFIDKQLYIKIVDIFGNTAYSLLER